MLRQRRREVLRRRRRREGRGVGWGALLSGAKGHPAICLLSCQLNQAPVPSLLLLHAFHPVQQHLLCPARHPGPHVTRACTSPGPARHPGLHVTRARTSPGPARHPGPHVTRARTSPGPAHHPGPHITRACTSPGPARNPAPHMTRACSPRERTARAHRFPVRESCQPFGSVFPLRRLGQFSRCAV